MISSQPDNVFHADFADRANNSSVYDFEQDQQLDVDATYDVFEVILAGLIGVAVTFMVIALTGVIAWSATAPAVGLAVAGVAAKLVDRASA